MDEKETTLSEIRQQLLEGIKRERNAKNDLGYSEKRVDEQREQLDTLLNYRKECASGLRSASHDLSYAQMRDYELLLEHLDDAVADQQYRLRTSQSEFEQCNSRWQQAHDQNLKIDAIIMEQQQRLDEQKQAEAEAEIEAEVESGQMPQYAKTRIKKQQPDDDVLAQPIKPSYR